MNESIFRCLMTERASKERDVRGASKKPLVLFTGNRAPDIPRLVYKPFYDNFSVD